MSDRWVLSSDPREGEWPEYPPDYCPHGVDQHEAACGRCMAEPAPMMTGSPHDDRELSAAEEFLLAALLAMFDKIREREDETKGAALAARFEKGNA